ncbi:nucleotidyltransferase domain-containing protein [Spirosoma validum]|uniref:Nucleotidyltransferase domain-containing protein n=1 Tax=Spirosoma validum TaxID=2771355 RepID=A0A927B424_9BACT|nr:nucleotidyltransferase domain-containing protein [Spirosoma validum]MBD2754827.1 nucleotidyltransferase domain-containing protein [Spirosoma validum]
MTDELFLQEVKRYVHEIDPQAEVWLFGSRARGDARDDSDWDFLVLTEQSVNRVFKYKVWDHLNDLELLAERVMSTRVQNKTDWEDVEVTDLYQNIKDDGRRL